MLADEVGEEEQGRPDQGAVDEVVEARRHPAGVEQAEGGEERAHGPHDRETDEAEERLACEHASGPDR
jgi:hypothetical protein